jgi:cobalt-zinc-cadmium efflux system membrane fusion protein
VAYASVQPPDHAGEHKADGDKHDHSHKSELQSGDGPHGGRMLADGDFKVEVTLFDEGKQPQFRVYCFDHTTPVDPAEVKLSMEVRRPGGVVGSFRFHPEAGYLFSDKAVEEPHSFTVSVTAEWRGKTYAWEYAQVDGHVELTSEAARAAGIEILSAGPQRVGSVFELPGEVSFNADVVAHVVPRVAGVISSSLKNLGDPVRKGELIAVIESREMAEAKSRYLVFLKREELARTVFERTENLWKKSVTPEQSYLNDKKALEEAKIETMAAAQKLLALGLSEYHVEALAQAPSGPLNRYELHAPFDGVVVKKHMAIGEWATENKDLMVLADLSTVWVEIIVYIKDLEKIRVGQKATVKCDASDLHATGVVSYVGPLVGEESRTARARVVLPNQDNRWRPGLFVTVKLAEEQVNVPVAVNKEAIQMLGDWSVVFVRDRDTFLPRPLQLGLSNGKFVEVVKGLSAGEEYAGRNSFLLKSQLGIGGLSHSH